MTGARKAGPRSLGALKWIAPAIVVLVTSLPFARGMLRGESLYFRDLSLHFLPLRLFALEGLRQGELRFWNPYVHEGEPMSLPPLSYPLDLLQALLPNEAGISASLALHVPLGALAFFALARGLGLGQGAAAGGALAYALGGFNLSTLNLYAYVQAAAWAPLVALGLRGAAMDRKYIAPAALASALALSTTGAEIVAQAFVLGLVLAAPGRSGRAWARILAAIGLGMALAAPVITIMAGLARSSARGEGFPTDVVLAHSIHPLTFAQTLVAGLYGDPGDLVNRWWGSNFFPKGFPYLLSLYLGATLLCLAVVGLREGGPLARRIAALAAVAGLVCLGRWAHLSGVVEALPLLRSFRFPSKAFFTVHAAVALLGAFGLDALAAGSQRAWRQLRATAAGAGCLLAAAPLVPWLAPARARWFAAGFFPPEYSWPDRWRALGDVLADAQKGGLVAASAALVAAVVLWRVLRPGWAAGLLLGLVTADLLRSGIGLNRTVDVASLHPSPEVVGLASSLREAGGRTYAPDPSQSPAYALGRTRHPGSHELWSFAVLTDSATPLLNMRLGLPSALSVDLTMLVPPERVTPPERAGPDGVPGLVPSLRDSGVAHILSLDPLADPALELRAVLAPARLEPLRLFVYALSAPLPMRSVASEVVVAGSREEARRLSGRPGFQEAGGVALEAPSVQVGGARGRVVSLRERPGRIEADVEADRPTVLFLRDAWAPGWSAEAGGRPAPVLRGNGRHCAVPVPAGRTHVTLRYSPPGLALATGLSVAAVAVLGLLWRSAAGSRRP